MKNASLILLVIGGIHIVTYLYSDTVLSLLTGSFFLFLSANLFSHGFTPSVEESPEIV
jgi:hypothetical protein